MPLSSLYDSSFVEKKWSTYWYEEGFFSAQRPSRKTPYTVVMPPPNVTGVLHLGHVLNNVIQDVLVRRAKMQGKQTYWVPGLDHAALATETKVIAMLKEKGLKKDEVGRDVFLDHTWAWKKKYGGLIIEQLKALGLACDWDRIPFSLDPSIQEAVQKAFISLYEKGYVYRSERMIHWDPQGMTALSDEEVVHREVRGELYYIKYPLVGSEAYITVATTRPETLLGDTAVCVHPDDERYKHLHNKKVCVPLLARIIPIIADSYVDKKMGTGCVKITPAHDVNDHAIGKRHNLPSIEIFHPDGTIHDRAGLYVGEHHSVVRKKIIQDLSAKGYLSKIVPHKHQVGFSERTHAVVEPRLSTQWFVKMKALAKPALEALEQGDIRFHPKKFQNLYTHWMQNIKDWCISRQLWWGHRIPAYYLEDGRIIVAQYPGEALVKARQLTGNKKLTLASLKQDEDVLDTWFSAWLWPMVVFDGVQKPDNPRFAYHYPTDDLVTAPDIIFFWVARMIMAGYAFSNQRPFKNVYFTGLVRDRQGRKMSKSLGNSPNPLDLIKVYGADSVRAGMLFCSPAGNDLLFDEKLCQQGARFAHKIFHALRLIKNWQVNPRSKKANSLHEHAEAWFKARFQQVVNQVNKHFAQYRISEALILIYKLIWDDFCSHYLEMIKPIDSSYIGQSTYEATYYFFEQLIILLHPFMPFLTEEIWHDLNPRKEKTSIVLTAWPREKQFDQNILDDAVHVFNLMTQIRRIQSRCTIKHKEVILYVQKSIPSWLIPFERYIYKATKVTKINVRSHLAGSGFVVHETSFCLPELEQTGTKAKRDMLIRDLAYTEGLFNQINAKLANEGFVQHAPSQIVAYEKKKRADALSKIKSLQALLEQT